MGSVVVFGYTSLMSLAVKSLNSLCCKDGKPPVGQIRAWSTVNP